MYPDKEINALSQTFEALKGLDRRAVSRIIDWVTDKFGLQRQESAVVQVVAVENQTPDAVVPVPAAVESLDVPEETGKKRRGRRPRAAGDIEDQTQSPAEPVVEGFFNYSSLKELLAAAKVKKNPAKILLAAAFLQENKGLKELTSNDISSDLKKFRVFIKNPSQIINSLMSKKVPLLALVGERGASKQSRKKFRVTEEGLRAAKSYLK